MTQLMTKPSNRLFMLTQRLASSTPDSVSVTKALATSSGEGKRTRGQMSAEDSACQARMPTANGTISVGT